jgi:hypothetical protein
VPFQDNHWKSTSAPARRSNTIAPRAVAERQLHFSVLNEAVAAIAAD